jgi:hypothetical protein
LTSSARAKLVGVLTGQAITFTLFPPKVASKSRIARYLLYLSTFCAAAGFLHPISLQIGKVDRLKPGLMPAMEKSDVLGHERWAKSSKSAAQTPSSGPAIRTLYLHNFVRRVLLLSHEHVLCLRHIEPERRSRTKDVSVSRWFVRTIHICRGLAGG